MLLPAGIMGVLELSSNTPNFVGHAVAQFVEALR
jgi:hypothetical protein